MHEVLGEAELAHLRQGILLQHLQGVLVFWRPAFKSVFLNMQYYKKSKKILMILEVTQIILAILEVFMN